MNIWMNLWIVRDIWGVAWSWGSPLPEWMVDFMELIQKSMDDDVGYPHDIGNLHFGWEEDCLA